MTKLTNDMRETITTAVMRYRFTQSCAALEADRAAFATEVYKDVYSEADRRQMQSLPPGWLPELSEIRAQFGDSGSRYGELSFNGRVYNSIISLVHAPQPSAHFRAPASHEHSCVKVYANDHPLCARYNALVDLQKAMEVEIKTAQRQTAAALASVTTIGRLVEMWPEIKPFTEGYDTKPRQLPAIPTTDLNKLLKLPVEAIG